MHQIRVEGKTVSNIQPCKSRLKDSTCQVSGWAIMFFFSDFDLLVFSLKKLYLKKMSMFCTNNNTQF